MAKKNFNPVNPALQFITTPEETPAANDKDHIEKPATKRGRPASKKETKSKRLNLLLEPSLCNDMQKIATMERTSVNDLINSLLKEYVNEHADTIEKYVEVFGEE